MYHTLNNKRNCEESSCGWQSCTVCLSVYNSTGYPIVSFICTSSCSQVTNSHEEGVYCLPHAIELLTNKSHHLKYCKLMYTYDQVTLGNVVWNGFWFPSIEATYLMTDFCGFFKLSAKSMWLYLWIGKTVYSSPIFMSLVIIMKLLPPYVAYCRDWHSCFMFKRSQI